MKVKECFPEKASIEACIEAAQQPETGDLFQSEWAFTEAVQEGLQKRLWKPTEVTRTSINDQVMELVFIFMTPEEFAGKFLQAPKDITEVRKGTLQDVCRLGSLEGIILRPDPVIDVEIDLKDFLRQADENNGKIRVSMDNSIWAYRRLIVRSQVGCQKSYCVMDGEAECRPEQHKHMWEWLIQDECGKRVQHHWIQLSDGDGA